MINVGVFSIVLSTQAFAQNIDCRIDSLLTKKQLSFLSKAKDIKRIGLNKLILGENVFKIEILNNKITNRLLVFLGEAHVKGPRSSYLGKKIIGQFNVRIIEGVPGAEVEAMKKNYPELYSSIGWKRAVFQYLSFNPFESTIYDASKNGKNFGLDELTKAPILNILKRILRIYKKLLVDQKNLFIMYRWNSETILNLAVLINIF